MKLVIEGVLQSSLPWGLVGIGVGIALVCELFRIPSLPFAVGVYLPVSDHGAGVPRRPAALVRGARRRRRGRGARSAASGVCCSAPGLVGGEGLLGVGDRRGGLRPRGARPRGVGTEWAGAAAPWLSLRLSSSAWPACSGGLTTGRKARASTPERRSMAARQRAGRCAAERCLGRAVVPAGLARPGARRLAGGRRLRGAATPAGGRASSALAVEVRRSLAARSGVLHPGAGVGRRRALREHAASTARARCGGSTCETGEVLEERPLAPELFGEGLAAVGDRAGPADLAERAWRMRLGPRLADARPARHRLPRRGLGPVLRRPAALPAATAATILTVRDPASFAVRGRLAVTLRGRPLRQLNELECAEGWVYANVLGSRRDRADRPAQRAGDGDDRRLGPADPGRAPARGRAQRHRLRRGEPASSCSPASTGRGSSKSSSKALSRRESGLLRRAQATGASILSIRAQAGAQVVGQVEIGEQLADLVAADERPDVVPLGVAQQVGDRPRSAARRRRRRGSRAPRRRRSPRPGRSRGGLTVPLSRVLSPSPRPVYAVRRTAALAMPP